MGIPMFLSGLIPPELQTILTKLPGLRETFYKKIPRGYSSGYSNWRRSEVGFSYPSRPASSDLNQPCLSCVKPNV
jgi:hypothetical protein